MTPTPTESAALSRHHTALNRAIKPMKSSYYGRRRRNCPKIGHIGTEQKKNAGGCRKLGGDMRPEHRVSKKTILFPPWLKPADLVQSRLSARSPTTPGPHAPASRAAVKIGSCGRVIGLSSTHKRPGYSCSSRLLSRRRSSYCGQNPQAAHRRLQVKKHGGCRLGATMPPPLRHAAFWHGQSVGRQKRCGNCCGMTPLAWTEARIPPYWISLLYRDVSPLNPGIVMVSLRVISLNAVRPQLRNEV